MVPSSGMEFRDKLKDVLSRFCSELVEDYANRYSTAYVKISKVVGGDPEKLLQAPELLLLDALMDWIFGDRPAGYLLRTFIVAYVTILRDTYEKALKHTSEVVRDEHVEKVLEALFSNASVYIAAVEETIREIVKTLASLRTSDSSDVKYA